MTPTHYGWICHRGARGGKGYGASTICMWHAHRHTQTGVLGRGRWCVVRAWRAHPARAWGIALIMRWCVAAHLCRRGEDEISRREIAHPGALGDAALRLGVAVGESGRRGGALVDEAAGGGGLRQVVDQIRRVVRRWWSLRAGGGELCAVLCQRTRVGHTRCVLALLRVD